MKYSIEAKDYGHYDVLVCGGGTAGVFAAIAAGKQGAKTLLVERTFTVGGMLTLGEAGITKFSEHCKDADVYKKEVLDKLGGEESKKVQVAGGLALEYVERMIQDGTALGTNGTAGSYVFTDKCEAQWTLMDMLEEAGVEVLYDTRVCMTLMEGTAATGVVVCNKDGFSRILASCIIDATGDADVAAYAGVPYHKGTSEEDLKESRAGKPGQMHAFGTMYRVRNVDFPRLFEYLEENPDRYRQHPFGVMTLENAKESYEKEEMCVFNIMIDGPDGNRNTVQIYNLPTKDEAVLLAHFACTYRDGDGLNARSISLGQKSLQDGVRAGNAYLKRFPGLENLKTVYVPDVGVRETRHIVGDYVLNAKDIITGRDFEDSIGCGGHPVDISPRPKEIEDMEMNHWRFHIPYRIMLPVNVENLLVTGRCISATRVASGAIRPTAQCMVMGEAAGVAAALCVLEGVSPRNIDITKLRDRLRKNGAIL